MSQNTRGRAALLGLAAIGATLTAAIIVAFLSAFSSVGAQSGSDLSATISDATDDHRFSVLDYELSHLPNRWLGSVARWFGADDLPQGQAFQRWFNEADPSARGSAERWLEALIQDAAGALQLDTPLPLFGNVRIVWPPVDIDISKPLAILAVSPRDEVRLLGAVLLDERPEQIDEMESAVERSGEWSAWVSTVGGVALYPAQIIEGRNFERTLDIIAHEWVHHYLAFYELGLAYGRSTDLRTINETVADIAGDEIAAVAIAASAFQQPVDAEAVRRQADIRSQSDARLRQLRIDVDALLSEGRIDDAELLMEEVRVELALLGRPYRRINQAFLAFRGSYGASPASTSDWGPRLFALREQSASLAQFMRDVRGIASAFDADELLPQSDPP